MKSDVDGYIAVDLGICGIEPSNDPNWGIRRAAEIKLMQTGQFLRYWREQLGISPRAVSERANTPIDRLNDIESGRVEASAAELESFARSLGLRLQDLLEDDIPKSVGPDSIRVLMKSAEDFSPSDQVRLKVTAAARAGLDLLSLRQKLGAPAANLGRFTPHAPTTTKSQPLHEQGSKLAQEVRKQLRITGPIASTRDLMAQTLRIPLLAAKLTDAGPDALSVYSPGSGCAVAVNTDGRNANKLVARFTVLHELAHVLFDRPGQGSNGIACQQWKERSLDIEVRANAFAMRMLLPEKDLRKLGEQIWKPEVFRRAMEEWGVHRTALALYAGRVHGLTDKEADARAPQIDTSAPLSIRDAEELEGEKEPIELVPMERRGELARLVIDGVRQGKLRAGEARELLRVDATVEVGSIADRLDLPLGT